tara:strand:- start:596 stop:1324 length:729 start_codon:yes stop_codon:yes gene_type:complete
VYDLREGDCLDILPTLKPESVDAVITDPPYGVGISAVHKFSTRKRDTGPKYGQEVAEGWDESAPVAWMAAAVAALKPGGAFVVFTDHKAFGTVWTMCNRAGLKPLQSFHWIKTNAPPNPRKNFQSTVEVAVFARKPGKVLHWGGGGATPNHYRAPVAAGLDRTEHPTQKNLDLMRHLVRLLTPTGGLVLDPFGGSGTTAVAAMLEKRRAIIIERDPAYCKISRKRLEQWERSDDVRQMELLT